MTDVEQSMQDLKDLAITAFSLAFMTLPVWGPVAVIAHFNEGKPPYEKKAEPVVPRFYGSVRAHKSVEEQILDEVKSINSRLLVY